MYCGSTSLTKARYPESRRLASGESESSLWTFDLTIRFLPRPMETLPDGVRINPVTDIRPRVDEWTVFFLFTRRWEGIRCERITMWAFRSKRPRTLGLDVEK